MFRPKFGVLCEVISGGKALYCKAEFPPMTSNMQMHDGGISTQATPDPGEVVCLTPLDRPMRGVATIVELPGAAPANPATSNVAAMPSRTSTIPELGRLYAIPRHVARYRMSLYHVAQFSVCCRNSSSLLIVLS